MRISARAQRIEPFYVMEVAKAAGVLAREVAHTDRPMIFLNIGEPDFTAPPLGMFLAGQLYKLKRGAHAIFCAKLNHHDHMRCIFRCRFAELQESE